MKKKKQSPQIIEPDRDMQMLDDAIQYGELITQHLSPCGDDLTLLVLKGHLIAEHLLEKILIRALGLEGTRMRENGMRLSFKQKLDLVRAVASTRRPGPNADILCAIEKLNDIRNRLAHNLRSDAEIQADAIELVKEYHSRAGTKLDNTKTTAESLRKTLWEVCRFLYSLRVHFYKLEQ